MKNAIILLLVLALSLPLTLKASGAESQENNTDGRPYSWYCMKARNGKAPPLPREFEFIGKYKGYYLDGNAPSRGDKVIYLTFDCGYENGNVEKTLDILKKHDAKGAFFVLGNLIKRNTELVKRMSDDGHLVCNHTSNHKNMTKAASKEEFKTELDSLNALMREYCGCEAAHFYRPPEGCFNENNLKWASELGYSTIFWSCAYDDWDNSRQMSAESAMEKLMSRLHNGEILLLHPTSSTNVRILDGFLTALENEGYRFGTLNELVSSS